MPIIIGVPLLSGLGDEYLLTFKDAPSQAGSPTLRLETITTILQINSIKL